MRENLARLLLRVRRYEQQIWSTQNLVGKADIIIDFRGGISSISLLKTTQVFQKMKPFEIMEIRGFDPDTGQDLFKVLPESSYEVIAMESGDECTCHQVRIRKRP